MTGKILAICRSDKKGTQKYEISEAHLIPEWGIEGDAHAGKWHRQVSLLSLEKIEEFRAKGANVSFGAFGENFVIQGVDLRSVPVGTIGGGYAEAVIAEEGRKMFREEPQPKILEVSLHADLAEEEGMICGGELEVFMDPLY